MPFCPNCGAGTSGAVCENCGRSVPSVPEIVAPAPPRPNVPPLAVGAVIGSAFRDAYAVTRKHTVPILIMGAIATVLGALLWNAFPKEPTQHFQSVSVATDIFILVIAYYALAASVRTIEPSFRFGFANWLGMVGWSIVAALLTSLAMFAFIIPAIWVGPKLSLTPYIYLLSNDNNGENPLGRSWRITTGHYWDTFGLVILLGLILGTVIFGITFLAVGLSEIPVLGVILAVPIMCVVYAWLYQFFYLALTRWTYLLMENDVAQRVGVQTAQF